ncbi:hypothetical protein P3W53_25485 [Pseudomonas denitrificans (nom. rej.)]|nr:hypothetical protein [Pseudomonas denitrificans (nom. rej.)]
MAIHRPFGLTNQARTAASAAPSKSRKSCFTTQERAQLERLTAQLRSDAHPRSKARWESQIEQLLEGKELTRSDIALASYYMGNSGSTAESAEAAQAFADAYRAG